MRQSKCHKTYTNICFEQKLFLPKKSSLKYKLPFIFPNQNLQTLLINYNYFAHISFSLFITMKFLDTPNYRIVDNRCMYSFDSSL